LKSFYLPDNKSLNNQIEFLNVVNPRFPDGTPFKEKIEEMSKFKNETLDFGWK